MGKLVVEGGAPGAALEIDGKSVGTLPRADPVWLELGRHEVALLGGPCEGEERRFVEVAPGSSITLRFEAYCQPRLCLQPCLSPPPPPPRASLPRLGAGAGPLVYMAVPRALGGEPGVAFGARVEASYTAPLSESFALGLGIAGLPVASREGALVPLGADVSFSVTPGPLRFGLGVNSGWMFVEAERSTDDTWRPRPSVFVHPFLRPVGFRPSDRVEFGAQLGLLLGTWASASQESFGAGFVTGSVWARLYFGERRRDWEDVATR